MSRQLFNYHICGLKICSEFDLGLVQTPFERADVTLTEVTVMPRFEAQEAVLKLENPVAEIAIYQNNKVFLAVKPDATEEDIRLEIIHTVLTELLINRKIVCLHGCVVTKEGVTAAFIAPSGMGKSTLAAALVKKKWNLVSDDLLLLSIENDRVMVTPSFLVMRLWDESVKRLALSESSKKNITNRPGKYALEDGKSACDPSARFRLTHLYHLDRKKAFAQIGLKKIDKKEQFWGLLKNTFASQLANSESESSRFRLFERLLDEVNYKALELPDDYALLEPSLERLLVDLTL